MTMKRVALFAVVAILVTSGLAGTVVAEDTKTLTGSFVWTNDDQTGDLEARFTPDGDGRWKVDFHFTWQGEPHVYSGMAEGSLSEGKLSGKVVNESKEATFTFEGSFENGAFSGTHAHIDKDSGKPQPTGTLTLKG